MTNGWLRESYLISWSFSVASQKMEAVAPYCHILMTEITYVKHTDAATAQ